MTSVPKIWIVDDDKAVRTVCRLFLKEAGFSVDEYKDGTEAVERWREESPALILLDVEMPRLNGWRTLEALRKGGCAAPILMMTHVADVPARVRGLEAGADDYLAKPFDPTELIARVKALLRRTASTPLPSASTAGPAPLRLGDVEIDFETKSATKAGAPLRLTRTDFALLKFLSNHRGKPLARADILRVVWAGQASSAQVLDTHLWRLRKKLGDSDATERQWLRNLPGIGYVLATESQVARG